MFALCLLYACGGRPESGENKETPGTTQEKPAESKPDTYDPKRGEGKWTAENLQLGALNPQMAAEGQKIQAMKCASCHKLNDERLVGPGWKGVTSRRKPEWIMNFITNPDPMITVQVAVIIREHDVRIVQATGSAERSDDLFDRLVDRLQ